MTASITYLVKHSIEDTIAIKKAGQSYKEYCVFLKQFKECNVNGETISMRFIPTSKETYDSL